MGKKTTGGAGGSGGGKPRKKAGPEVVIRVKAESKVGTKTVMMMTLTSTGSQGVKVEHQDRPWPMKNHIKRAQFTP